MPTITAPTSAFRFHPTLWLCAATLMAFPALGTMVSDEVNWALEDFAIFGLMLAALCAGLEAAWYFLASSRWRIGVALLAVLMFLTVWAHLAVDLFD
jgi:hypothetical protein